MKRGNVVALVIVGIAALWLLSENAPAQTTTTTGVTTYHLFRGREYLIVNSAPVGPPMSVDGAQRLFDSLLPGALRVVRIAQPTPNEVDAWVVALSDMPITLPSTITLHEVLVGT